ncbi:hypothetical protein HF086_012446 [Spodoptera exigua]|uniref:Integrin beta n=1 Tax=Spodoptera exigua TaxID=7107 RepID=A0A922M5U0_SPOEX|nr:hypothetical protein HF086_012446 [Spodoptera exigua]
MYGISVFAFFYLFFVKIDYGNCQVQQMQNKLVCIEHNECGACLSAAAHCRWCADINYNSGAPRCNDDESLVNTGCSQGLIQRPEKSVWEVVENSSLQDMTPNSKENVVQIQPQRIHLSLKPRETKKIQFSYRPAKNYPLDLYYLMDLTWSMKDDKETLVTDARRRANPCSMEEEACEATYSYKHHLSLTNQVNEFIEHVNSSSVTANLDNAEAQLDALVQVIACGDKIGWAEHSRKIIILLSDGLMHTAGDGKLESDSSDNEDKSVKGGATKKNDDQCHLDDKGYYSDAATYDYPSIAQLYRLLEKYKVNVIFAVTESVKDHYDSLNQLLEDFTYVAKLESDSSNILKLVKTGYEDIVSVVDFHDDSNLGPVKIRYFTDCGVEGGPLKEETRCTGVEFGMTLRYEAHVTLESCPEYKSSTQRIRISESQLGQDALTLEVDIQCGCACSEAVQENMSPMCPVNAHFVCGVCQCNKGWSGPNCDCAIGDENASAELLAQCREPNATRALTCSGAGDCLCGECDCDIGFTGRYCQCKLCEISLFAYISDKGQVKVNVGTSKHMMEWAQFSPKTDDLTTCILRLEEDDLECEYKYTYSSNPSSGVEITIGGKECYRPTSAKIMTSAVVIMGCVIAAGLIVILFIKCGQIMSDRRAYAKFVKEAQESRKNMQELNPLYISPISEFKLPDSFPRDKND